MLETTQALLFDCFLIFVFLASTFSIIGFQANFFSIKSKIIKTIEVQKINPKLEISYLPLPQDDPLQRKPDISLARKELLWEPKINIKEGLEKTIPWFKEEILKNL